MAQASIIPLPPGFSAAGYRIERPLAMGGFSIVYRAISAQGAPVAIKEYLPRCLASRVVGLIPQVKQDKRAAYQAGMMAFYEEGIALAKLDHPNVVRVLDFFRANETVYLVMRLESGCSLAERIRRARPPLPEDFLLRTFGALLLGLAEVHAHGLLHLDIKPANIFLREDESPVLLDFGAARHVLAAQDPLLRPTYTPGYAAPELQLSLAPPTPRTDLYAVGATLYACLTGHAPPAADLRLAQAGATPATAGIEARHAPDFLRLIEECLALKPQARPESALALRQRLLTLPSLMETAT
ncbi:MAG: serine/threonine protein kinase [Rhodocyclaceae bacterium]|nr:serine/threonine protein kinase [Rhodocyclaceae bacterium]